MITINLFEEVGSFAEDKDKAREIRLGILMPSIKDGKEIVLDFNKVDSATQSFVHALISDVIRVHGIDVLEKLFFKNCTDTVKKIINIVVEYMVESQ